MDPSESEPDEIHTGYKPEQGVLARVREWTDIFGWLRLGRVLRLAGSPTALVIVAVALAVWLLGFRVTGMPIAIESEYKSESEIFGSQLSTLNSIVATGRVSIPSSILDRPVFHQGFWGTLLSVAWSLLIWTPVMLFLIRQGALLTAGRSLDDAKSVARLAVQRTPHGWFAAIMPLACALALGLLINAIGFVSRVAMGIQWIEFAFAVGAAVVAIVGGILLFGANFAVPLRFASLMNEPQPDSLDSLSRGYEYLYRRPLQLAMYTAISIVPLWVVASLSVGISASATHFSSMMLFVVGAPEDVVWMTNAILSAFPIVVSITLLGGLIGGVYLQLRSDAGGQEVEDIWIPEPEAKRLLPKLPDDLSSEQ